MATNYRSPQWLMPENSNQEKVSNYSTAFDGVDQYINGGNASELQITSNISISCWFKTTSSSTMMVISKRNSATPNPGYGYQLYIAGNLLRFLVTLNGINTYTATGTTIINDGEWHHVLGTINQNVQISIILDGSTEASNSIGPESFIESDTPLQLGYNQVGASSYYFEGQLDEFALFNSLVSASSLIDDGSPADISSLPNLISYLKLGEDSIYTSSWLIPNVISDSYSKFCFQFDGIDDQIQFTKTNIDTAISVSCWVKTTDATSRTKTIVNEDDGSGADRNWIISIGSTQKLSFVIWHTDLTQTQCTDTLASRVQDGAWHHILGTWDGTTNADSMKLYVDGNIIDSDTPITTGVTLDSTLGLSIGALQNNINWNFNGSIDEVAVWGNGININDVWDGSGKPTDIAVFNPDFWYRMGEDATYNGTDWNVPDQVGSNDGTSDNMDLSALSNETPESSGAGISLNMNLEDRKGDAKNSNYNSLSFNMESDAVVSEVPT